jgi:hypothetical protein
MFNLDANKHQEWAAKAVRKPMMNPRKPTEQLDPDLFITARGFDCIEHRNKRSELMRRQHNGEKIPEHVITAELLAACTDKIEGLTDGSGKEIQPSDYKKLFEDYPDIADSAALVVYDQSNFTPPSKG